jgi:hypothetical protein
MFAPSRWLGSSSAPPKIYLSEVAESSHKAKERAILKLRVDASELLLLGEF